MTVLAHLEALVQHRYPGQKGGFEMQFAQWTGLSFQLARLCSFELCGNGFALQIGAANGSVSSTHDGDAHKAVASGESTFAS